MTPRYSRDYLHHNSIIRLLIACGAASSALVASESDAAIVWSGDINVQTSYWSPVNLDLDSDSNNEYIFHYWAVYGDHSGPYWSTGVTSGEPGAEWAVSTGGGLVVNLPSGVAVDSNLTFGSDIGTLSSVGFSDSGNWNGAGTSGYIGLSFDISGQTHYGWASITNGGQGRGVILTGWAYETEPDVGIQTGAIPEPSTLITAILGFAGLIGYKRRPRR